ncbi:DNA polymerase IV [Methylocapsa palsarum]
MRTSDRCERNAAARRLRDSDSAPAPARLRKIIHVDMDAFFASVEQRDNPELRGKPVAVGGSRERGVVAAASYEARQFGVRSAMPSILAKLKCPDLVFVKPRFEISKAISQHMRAIFAEYTPLIEPLSLDEAYLDVTDNLKNMTVAREIAEDIRAKIRAATDLTASAGVSYNKFLAKLASDHRKADGLFVITPRMGPGFVETLPVRKFHGVGPATAAKMNRLGIATGLDLKERSLAFLQHQFGKSGSYYYSIARGIDERSVRADRVRKSVGAENTFFTDLFTFDSAREALQPLLEKVWRHCESAGTRGRTVTLKVKYADFQQITRSRTGDAPIVPRADLERQSLDLLAHVFPVEKGVRLLGVSLSSLEARNTGKKPQSSFAL